MRACFADCRSYTRAFIGPYDAAASAEALSPTGVLGLGALLDAGFPRLRVHVREVYRAHLAGVVPGALRCLAAARLQVCRCPAPLSSAPLLSFGWEGERESEFIHESLYHRLHGAYTSVMAPSPRF